MEKDTKAYWDESTEDFQRRVAGHGWNLEKDPALAILKRIGALQPEGRVLNIGCGMPRRSFMVSMAWKKSAPTRSYLLMKVCSKQYRDWRRRIQQEQGYF